MVKKVLEQRPDGDPPSVALADVDVDGLRAGGAERR
jgi:hypothetical protein